jgi:hypothetical protein
MLFAVSLNGCGRTGGGASEVTAAGPSANQQQPDIRVAEATQAPTSSQSAGVVADGVYDVCDVEKDEKEAKTAGSHLTLHRYDEVDVNKGEKAKVGSVIFRHFDKEVKDREKRKPLKRDEITLPVVNCCEGQRLGATMGFEHRKNSQAKNALHAILIENAPTGSYDTDACPRKPVIVIQYCYPTDDDKATSGYTCGEDRNTHGGDVHAQL